MALSNILKEPRREITETVIGLLAFGPLMYWDVVLAGYLQPKHMDDPFFMLMVVAMVLLAFGIACALGLLLIVHAVGEALCDRIEQAGWQIRPRRT